MVEKLVWQYNGVDVSESSPPMSCYGFVYELTLLDGKKYMGKKSMWGTAKKSLTKKELEDRPSKRHKKWKYVTKEAKWRDYTGSSKLFGSRDIVKKTILILAKSKRHLTYLETKLLFQNDVLENELYLNDNIGGRYFADNLI